MARTVHYFDWEDLIGLIPEAFAIEALDDDADGTPEMWDTVRDAAEDAVDAYLEGRYPVPMSEPSALVKRAAILFAAHDCYARRKVPELFANKDELKSRRASLEDIRNGKTQVTPTIPSARARGAVIQTPSRVHGSGRMGS